MNIVYQKNKRGGVKMSKKLKWLLMFLILCSSTIFESNIQVYAEEKNDTQKNNVLKRPNLSIDNKGKVSIQNKKGKVSKKGKLFTQLIKKYRVIVAGISGIGALSMILFFILGFMRLGATSSNPEARHKTIVGLIATGIASAGLGAVTFIVGMFFNSL